MPKSDSNSDPRAGTIAVHAVGLTDVGRSREHNEDSFAVADLSAANSTTPPPELRTPDVGERGALFMIADGMGGAAAGELASAMAVETVLREMHEGVAGAAPLDAERFVSALRTATEAANESIHTYASAHPEHRGMGTTATIAGVLRDTLYLAQVGDSRAYLARGGRLRQITKDQSLLQRLIEAGEITPEEAEKSDRRNIILQALGPEALIRIDLTYQQLRRGDVLVLCSDGLSTQVGSDDIAKILSDSTDLTEATARLVALANEMGGPDNITVIAVRFDGEGLPEPGPDDEVGHRVFPMDEPPLTMDDRWQAIKSGFHAAVSREDFEPPEPVITPVERGPGTHRALLIAGIVLATFAVALAYTMLRPD